ncbi:MAG: porin family protein [Scytonematopsis contorta HA4267-MV1]|jgi:hypothetical protein|nr:porin family protein [Scytonematopsis contorta HA4267-MV1]
MHNILKRLVTITALSSVVVAPFVVGAGKASAEDAKGLHGNYVGAGVAAGVTNGGVSNDAATFGGNVSARVQVLKMGDNGVSARTQVLFSDQTSCINPSVSADLGIAKNTNLYVAGGYCFVEKDGKPTPLGNRDSFTAAVGVETAVNRNMVIYSNATLGSKAYQNSAGDAVSINGGVGLRF